jgi:thymidylate synthase
MEGSVDDAWSGTMREYLRTLLEVYERGEKNRKDRTGVGTWSMFAPREMKFDFEDGFPIVTTKRIAWKSIVWELLFFLRGETNNNWLKERGVSIWNEWAREDGYLGPIYGHQWRYWGGDQLARVVEEIRTNPTSRRMVVSAWNADQIGEMALPPCHVMWQMYCHGDGGLSMKLTQRSGDMFLGVPFNISSYALLLALMAKLTGREPRTLTISLGDAHIYGNHVPQVTDQLERQPLPLPELVLPDIRTIEELCNLTPDDIRLVEYRHHPALMGQVAV